MVKASLYLGTPVESTRVNPTEIPAEMLTFQVMGLFSYEAGEKWQGGQYTWSRSKVHRFDRDGIRTT
jgi:hypothetical protein